MNTWLVIISIQLQKQAMVSKQRDIQSSWNLEESAWKKNGEKKKAPWTRMVEVTRRAVARGDKHS